MSSQPSQMLPQPCKQRTNTYKKHSQGVQARKLSSLHWPLAIKVAGRHATPPAAISTTHQLPSSLAKKHAMVRRTMNDKQNPATVNRSRQSRGPFQCSRKEAALNGSQNTANEHRGPPTCSLGELAPAKQRPTWQPRTHRPTPLRSPNNTR